MTKKITVRVIAGTAIAILLLLCLEGTVRVIFWARNTRVTSVPLPYVVGDDYEPVPPWLDSLLILAPDPDLVWRNRPNLNRRYVDLFQPARSQEDRLQLFRRFSPQLPATLLGSGTWELALNSEGFRDMDVRETKPTSTFRIICLGDSWTFGINVNQEQTYPSRLAGILHERFPSARFEVLNRGVLGYSSFQGVQLMPRLMRLNPDIVVIAYAMNDSKITGYHDRDAAEYEKHLPMLERIRRLAAKGATYNLLNYFAGILRRKPKPIGDYLREEADGTNGDFKGVQQWARVPLSDYRDNILEMVRMARSKGAEALLVYNELWENGPYLDVLREISTSESVPLVDGSAIIGTERRKLEKNVEQQLHLEASHSDIPARDDDVEVVFRVYAGAYEVPHALFITGSDPALGNLVPNKVAMHDDGANGDQIPGDFVWSYAAKVRRGTKLVYVYTNSGPEGRWEGLDVPHIRTFDVPASPRSSVLYVPIDEFGKVYMQADSWHTNALGYDRIASEVLKILEKSPKVVSYLNSLGSADARGGTQ